MHEKYEDLLLLYMTHSISAGQLAELQIHITQCTACRASLNEWHAISNAVKQKARDRELLLAKEQKLNIARPYPAQRQGLSAAAALTLILIVLISGLMTFVNRVPSPSYLAAAETGTPTHTFVDVVIAIRPIENGAVIHPDDVMTYSMPTEGLRFAAMTSVDNVVYNIARTNIACGQLILQNQIVANARDVADDHPNFRPDAYACDEGDLDPLPTPMEFVEVVIALRVMPAGTVISAENVDVVPYPAQLVPAVALRRVGDVIGHTTRTDIYTEQMIFDDYVQEWVPPTSTPIPLITTTATVHVVTSTPSITPMPTPVELCAVVSNSGMAINVRAEPNISAGRVAVAEPDTALPVIEVHIGDDNVAWYRIRVQSTAGLGFEGWVRSDAVRTVNDSPACPLP